MTITNTYQSIAVDRVTCSLRLVIFQRSSDRSWKQLWGVLRGPILFFYKDRQNQVFRKRYVSSRMLIKFSTLFLFLLKRKIYDSSSFLESFVILRW